MVSQYLGLIWHFVLYSSFNFKQFNPIYNVGQLSSKNVSEYTSKNAIMGCYLCSHSNTVWPSRSVVVITVNTMQLFWRAEPLIRMHRCANFEHFLLNLSNYSSPLKFRISNHQLLVETSCWTYIPPNDRNYHKSKCSKNDNGDEFHYLFVFEYFQSEQLQLWPATHLSM